MKVQLAYAYGEHQPDATIDLPDKEAERLVGDGRARRVSKYRSAEKVDPVPPTDDNPQE